ncbi:TPA: hypothetical protein JK693_000617 [Escherichia coli]|nr:hypothetical protein [Escherichia coli]HBA6231634.1 hypothetical protein [Escherichia coli]HBB9455434.1 hypothetical protein [Escherichia coli]
MSAEPTQTPATSVSQTRAGRITKYNDRIAKQICLYVAQGMSLRKIALQPGMPSWATLNVWQIEHPELRQTIEALRFIVATEYAAQALECFDDVDPDCDDFPQRLALAKARAATLLGMARLQDLRKPPQQIQENEE